MTNKKGDGLHPNKKIHGKCHQLSTSAKNMVIPGHYNPLGEEANINKLEKFHLTN